MKNKYIFGLCTLILFFFIFLNLNSKTIKKLSFKVFSLDGKYVPYNKNKQIHGEAIEYIDGKIHVKESFVNGLREGWAYEYHKNGRLSRKTHFSKGKPDGSEFLFDEKGRIVESRNYLRGSPYGDWFKYDTLGTLTKYSLIDISGGIIFSSKADLSGNLNDMHGHVVSSSFYSFDANQSVVNLMERANYLNKGFKDLYITVVHIPNNKLIVSVNINGVNYSFNNINSSTIRIPNIFKYPGEYNITLKSNFFNRKGEAINGININGKVIMK